MRVSSGKIRLRDQGNSGFGFDGVVAAAAAAGGGPSTATGVGTTLSAARAAVDVPKQMVKRWSRDGQEMVKRWSRDGQEMVKRWSRDGQEIENNKNIRMSSYLASTGITKTRMKT
jgi:hypothetical protein